MEKDPHNYAWSDWAERMFRDAAQNPEEGSFAELAACEASTKCHECTLADYGIRGHTHCGTCYCCKGK